MKKIESQQGALKILSVFEFSHAIGTSFCLVLGQEAIHDLMSLTSSIRPFNKCLQIKQLIDFEAQLDETKTDPGRWLAQIMNEFIEDLLYSVTHNARSSRHIVSWKGCLVTN